MSATAIRADQYQVQVDDELADMAKQLLDKMPMGGLT
jgi:hypothetical protein